jgi:hypothetical protein
MNSTHTTRRAWLGSLSVAALAMTAALPARAQDELVIVEAARATMFINGGVGQDEENYMHKVAKDWSLRMIFSERKDNEFVAGVSLLVTDKQGRPYLQLDHGGPLTYAMLPAGTYSVTARFHGQAETREVTLDGKTGRDVYFHWKGRTKTDALDGRPLGGKQAPG